MNNQREIPEEFFNEDEYNDSEIFDREAVKKIVLTIPNIIAGMRLDKALRDIHPKLSRAQWQRLIRQGNVYLRDEIVRANYKVSGGEEIVALLPPPTPSDLIPENIPLDVIYEDQDMLAINKAAGIVMHPAVGHESGTVANAIVYHYPHVLDVGGERRPGLVHRLDKNTSGVVLIAKHDRALNHLVGQFKDRTIKKVYLALVDGRIKPEKALIDAPIGRNPADRKRMTVIEPGTHYASQPSKTRYEAREFFANHTLVTCYPITGRTHQIRVHLSFINYPIVGDHIYGRRKPTVNLWRQFLHAHEIHFRRPSDNKPVELKVPLPTELEQVLSQLRK
ncbi:MAG: RluA family pseudouridine synthase [Ardenticatenaceae bacterium]|nr:RluA family pseudouridine synthase [Ardenticatenaceae bacterium]